MKKIICFLICLNMLLLPNQCFAGGIFGMVNTFTHRIGWDVQGGNFTIKDGIWRFGRKSEIRNKDTGRVVRVTYTCFYRFTIVNNSDKPYKIIPTIYLYDRSDFELYSKEAGKTLLKSLGKEETLLPIQLKPSGSETFEGKFTVFKATALETSKFVVKLAYYKWDNE